MKHVGRKGDRGCFLIFTDGALGKRWGQRPHLSKQTAEFLPELLAGWQLSVGDFMVSFLQGLLNPSRCISPIVSKRNGSGEQKE